MWLVFLRLCGCASPQKAIVSGTALRGSRRRRENQSGRQIVPEGSVAAALRAPVAFPCSQEPRGEVGGLFRPIRVSLPWEAECELQGRAPALASVPSEGIGDPGSLRRLRPDERQGKCPCLRLQGSAPRSRKHGSLGFSLEGFCSVFSYIKWTVCSFGTVTRGAGHRMRFQVPRSLLLPLTSAEGCRQPLPPPQGSRADGRC